MTFIIKKLITCAILPPGFFIILLLVSALFLKKKARIFVLLLAGILYASSIGPVSDLLLRPLENAYKPPALKEVKTGSVYIVLGGGAVDDAPDLEEKAGSLNIQALSRHICAFRLYRIDRKPIILSGGFIFERRPEAEIAKQMLLSLGVDEKDIIMESRSRDTYENAKYARELSEKHNFNKIVLITSAFHMKRSMLLFKMHFKEIIPCPTGYITSGAKYDILSYLPNAGNLERIAIALKEYMGIILYRITL